MKPLLLLFLLIAAYPALCQQQTSGVVINAQGEPLAGATVAVKGGAGGAITDSVGRFLLTLPESANTLLVSCIGYTPLEVVVAPGRWVEIRLSQDGIPLPETVVTALNIKRERKALGYATQQIEGRQLSEVRETNMVNSMAGKIAGMQVFTSSGNLGSSTRIVIRGIRSLTGENQPLFVVDGMPMDNSNLNSISQQEGYEGVDYGNTIQDINPNDIESVNVLKGAAAAALYGSRAANGVIVITTRKGDYNMPVEVSYSSQTTFERVAVLPDYQNEYGGGYGPFKLENGEPVVNFAADASWGPKFDPNLNVRQWYSYFPEIPEYYGKATPWVAHPNNIRDFFETGVTLNNAVSIRGGGPALNARLSYANLRQTGIYPNSLLNRHQMGVNASWRVKPWLNFDANINYTTHRARGRANTGNSPAVTNSLTAWHQRQIDMAILKKYYKTPDGRQISWNLRSSADTRVLSWDNPYWQAFENTTEDGRDRTFGNLTANIRLGSTLSITARAGIDQYTDNRQEKKASGSGTWFKFIEFYGTSTYRVSEFNTDLLLNYRKNFGPDFSLFLVLGGNLRQNHVSAFSAKTDGLKLPNYYHISNSVGTPNINESTTTSRVNGVFSTANIGYKSWLYLELTARNDWSSTLPPGSNAILYPSSSLGFVFSELGRLASSRWLSFGKLRLNWAQVGLDAPPYALQTSYVISEPIGAHPVAALNSTQKTPDLKPQQTVSTEAGLELRLFRDRLGLDLACYRTNSKNQILNVPVSGTTGFTSKFVNAGLIRNQGVEFTLTVAPLVRPHFRWDASINWARNYNEIVELYRDDKGNHLDTYLLGQGFANVAVAATEGEPYGTLRGGDFYRDANGNPVVDPLTGNYLVDNTSRVLGNTQPDWIGGIQNALTYKGLTLSFLVDFRKGSSISSGTVRLGRATGIFQETADGGIRETGAALPGVLQATDDSGNPLFNTDGSPVASDQPNDKVISARRYWGSNLNKMTVFDAGFVKLREVRLGYQFPGRLLVRWRLKDLNLALVGRNLWLIHKNVPHIDPDNAYSSGNLQGIELGQIPSTRTLGLNLSLRF